MNGRPDFVAVYVVRSGESGGNEVLQLRRSPGRYLAGYWSFPGGRVEAGETAVAAAFRELHEETGLEPPRMTFVSHVEQFYLPADDALRSRVGFCAIIDRDADVQLNEESDAHRWIGRGDFSKLVLWPGERAALAEVWREHLRGRPATSLRVVEPPGR